MAAKISKELEDIKEITTFIKTKFRDLYEVYLGGSRSQGTHLDNSDFDIVLYTKNISPEMLLSSPEIKNYREIIEIFQKHFHSRFHVLMTDHLRYMNPNWRSNADFLGYLKTIPPSLVEQSAERFRYTGAKWNAYFFEKQHPKVKEYIRKAKIWRSKVWILKSDVGIPKCYLLSLLVIRACELASPNKHPDEVKQQIIHLVENYPKMNIYWEVFYNIRDFPNVPKTYPRLLCPWNPYDNIANGAFLDGTEDGKSDWPAFVYKIHHIELN